MGSGTDDDAREITAYGARFVGLGSVEGQQPAPDPTWERWTVRQEIGAAGFAHGVRFDPGRAEIGLRGGGGVAVDAAMRTVTFIMRREVPAEALLHPGLVSPAAVIALWAERASLHGAALLAGEGVWGLLADREGGKSTTAALLVERGCELFTDDMLIVDRDTAFAGPGSIDLRPESAQALGGEFLGVIGERERWRKRVAVRRAAAPLAGFVVLEWGEEIRMRPLQFGDRMKQLDTHLSLPVTGDHLLDLASLPMLEFTRPRDLSKAGEGVDALLAGLGQQA